MGGLADMMTSTARFHSISAVLPAFNEEDNIEAAALKMLDVLKTLPFPQYEVIIVNDGSRDRTGEVSDNMAAKYPGIRVIHHPTNLGYAQALRITEIGRDELLGCRDISRPSCRSPHRCG